MGASPPARRGAGGGRATIVVIVVAAVLAVALFGADVYARRRVQHEAASQLQTQLGTPLPPQLQIAGTPFLTQVAARSLRSVHLVADDVGQTNGATLAIQHVDMMLTDVTTHDWWKTMTVGHAQGTALVAYPALQAAAGVPLTYAGGGRFTIDSTSNVYGVTLQAKVTGGLALDVASQSVALTDPTIEVAGVTLPDTAAQALIASVVRPIPLRGVPFDLKVTSIDAQDDGLHADLVGDDIPVTR